MLITKYTEAFYNDSETEEWDDITVEQRMSIIKPVSELITHYKLDKDDIYAHHEISYRTGTEGQKAFEIPIIITIAQQ